jgi:RNA polymerase sigma-70 factor (ECF subfamily)
MKAGIHHMTQQDIETEMVAVLAAQASPEKFELIYNSYYERILSFIYSRVETKEEAYELTSQVFFKALDNIRKYRPQGLPFGAWLFRIALNEISKFFRKSRHKRVMSVDAESVAELCVEMEEEKQEDTDRKLSAALQKLSPEELQLIEMRFFDKIPFKEISRILELSEAGAKARVYRILEKMKQAMQA